MGACPSFPAPDTTNPCSGQVGDLYEIPNFCTLAGSHTDVREDYCSRLGSEWTYHSQGSGCQYNDCDERTAVEVGCCKACCGISGRGALCRRTAFAGDPLLCCLRDQQCTGSEACFTDATRSATCAPEHRDQSSSACQEELLQWCTGQLPGGEREPDAVWRQRWLGEVTVGGQSFQQPCYAAVYRSLYAGQPGACLGRPGVGVPTAAGFAYAQRLVEAAFTRYAEDGGTLNANEGSSGNTSLNALLWDICTANPGLCQSSLQRICAGQTLDSLSRNAVLLPWCGCNLAPSEYSKYTDIYQINQECTPTCNLQGVLPLPTEDGTGVRTCSQSLCVVDDISIAIANSEIGTTGAGISFSQLCGSCTDGQCACYLTGTTFEAIDANIPNLRIREQCGGTANCYAEQQGEDGSVQSIRVPCTENEEENPFEKAAREAEEAREKALQRRNLWIGLILLVLVIVVAIIWLLGTTGYALRLWNSR